MIGSEHKNKEYKRYYAINQSNKSKTGKALLLHRYLMDAPSGLCVDHSDGNEFNNRKDNLRVCTNQENIMNSKLHKFNKSGHKGVYWDHFFEKSKMEGKYKSKLQNVPPWIL